MQATRLSEANLIGISVIVALIAVAPTVLLTIHDVRDARSQTRVKVMNR